MTGESPKERRNMSENNRNLEPMPEEAVHESPLGRLTRTYGKFRQHNWKIDDMMSDPKNKIILGQREHIAKLEDLLDDSQQFAKAILDIANELAADVNYHESVVTNKGQRIAELEAQVAKLTAENDKLKALKVVVAAKPRAKK